jgi:hypothetical protein
VVVHLLLDRPAGRIDRGEPRLPPLQRLGLLRHGRGRVIGRAVAQPGLLEGTPLREQRDQVLICAGCPLRGGDEPGTEARNRRDQDAATRGCAEGHPGHSTPRQRLCPSGIFSGDGERGPVDRLAA